MFHKLSTILSILGNLIVVLGTPSSQITLRTSFIEDPEFWIIMIESKR